MLCLLLPLLTASIAGSALQGMAAMGAPLKWLSTASWLRRLP